MPLPKTQAEVDAHNQRVAAGRARRSPVAAAEALSTVPLSGHRSTRQIDSQRESDVAECILQEIKRRGWICFRSNPTQRTGRMPGEPDLEVWADGGRTFHIELKRPVSGKLSTEQLGVIAWAKKLGHTVHTARSLEDFLEIVDGSTIPPAA